MDRGMALLKYQDHEFGTMKGHDYFSMVAMNGGYFPGNSGRGQAPVPDNPAIPFIR